MGLSGHGPIGWVPVASGSMTAATGAMEGVGAQLSDPAPSTAAALMPGRVAVVAPLIAGGILIGALALFSRVSEQSLPAWSSAILMLAGLAAVAGILRGVREAEAGLDRIMRFTLGGAAFFYAVGRMLHLVSVLSGIPMPAALDAVPLIGLLAAVVGCWWVGLRMRFSRSEQLAIALDSAVVFCTAGAASLVLLGSHSSDDRSVLALVYTVVFSSALGATMVLNLAITPRRGAFGWVAIVAGILPLVLGSAWEVTIPTGGWAPYAVLQAAGVLLCAFGAATWTGELDSSERFRQLAARARGWLPLAAVGVAPILIIANQLMLPINGQQAGIAADGLLAAVLVLCVVRQTTLIRDREGTAAVARDAALRELALVEDLRASERRFRSLVTNSSDVFLIISPEGRVTYQSPAIERVLGYAPDDRMGRQIFEIIHPDDIGLVQGTIAELITTPGGQRTIEIRSRHADGSLRTLEATGSNMVDDPAVGGIVVNYRDITERKVLEEQLQKENQKFS